MGTKRDTYPHTKSKTYILVYTCTHNKSITRECCMKIKSDSKTKSSKQIKSKCKNLPQTKNKMCKSSVECDQQ
jgi:hypothetical protein